MQGTISNAGNHQRKALSAARTCWFVGRNHCWDEDSAPAPEHSQTQKAGPKQIEQFSYSLASSWL